MLLRQIGSSTIVQIVRTFSKLTNWHLKINTKQCGWCRARQAKWRHLWRKGAPPPLDTVLTALPKIIRIYKGQANSHPKIVCNKFSLSSKIALIRCYLSYASPRHIIQQEASLYQGSKNNYWHFSSQNKLSPS